jgi:hypothetical protein
LIDLPCFGPTDLLVQLVENRREGGRVRQEHVATLGFAALDRKQRTDRDVRHRVRASGRGTGHNMKEAPRSIAEE